MNKKQQLYDNVYMNVAYDFADMSHCERRKVGAIAVKNNRVIGEAWNGMPPGWDNCCEDKYTNGNLVSKPEVQHAESNLISKIAKSPESSEGCDMYVTYEPCFPCSKLLVQAGVKRIFYCEEHATNHNGIQHLQSCGVEVKRLQKLT